MPNGGFRLVANALKAYGFEPEPQVVEAFTKYRKTHNDAVFDAYTADMRRCRSSHVLTGLPDAYGRGRIIGDYRRVALYGVNRLIERKQEEKRDLDSRPSSDDVIRDREELAEQIRALRGTAADGSELRLRYLASGGARRRKPCSGCISGTWPASRSRTARRCRWAGRRRSSTSTSNAIWRLALLTEEQAQEIVDDFVIKLRIVRFLRTPEYDDLFAGDPTWVTESIAGMGDDGRSLVTKTELPLPADALQPRAGAGAEPDHLVFAAPARRVPPLRRQGRDRHQLDPVRER